MARCSRCDTKIGVFAKAYKRADATLCEPCVVPWYDERKQESLQSLCEGGEPVEFFSIPLVQCRDPHVRNGQNRLIGNLAFTDKGICFVQIGEYRRSGDSLAHLFGLVGHLIAASGEAAKKQRALAQGQLAVLENAKSFQEILQRSPRLIVLTPEQISNVTYGWWNGFCVHLEKQQMHFQLRYGRKDFKQHRQGIEEFLEALRNYRQNLPMQ